MSKIIMSDSIIKFPSEYVKLIEQEFKVNIKNEKKRYNDISNSIRNRFQNSQLWKGLLESFNEWNDEYAVQEKFSLFEDPKNHPEISVKEWDSFLDKTFRTNVLENTEKEWKITPNNWLSKIDDIIRTRIVVKYIDGVKFLINKIDNYCNSKNVEKRYYKMKSTEEGYYAGHFYIKKEFRYIQGLQENKRIRMFLEIQISTQLQDVIYTLLHKYYDRNRLVPDCEKVDWKWDFKKDEFSTNYLGHILHYLEGKIYDVREIQKKGE